MDHMVKLKVFVINVAKFCWHVEKLGEKQFQIVIEKVIRTKRQILHSEFTVIFSYFLESGTFKRHRI